MVVWWAWLVVALVVVVIAVGAGFVARRGRGPGDDTEYRAREVGGTERSRGDRR